MISTLAGYVNHILDRVTISYVDIRDTFFPSPNLTLQEEIDGSWRNTENKAHIHQLTTENMNVTLIFNPARFLNLTLSLPSGAKPYLTAVIASQIDRISPWTADKAIFGAIIATETSTGLSARVVIAARAEIDRRIGNLGIKPIKTLSLKVPVEIDSSKLLIDLPYQQAGALERRSTRKIISAVFYGTISLFVATTLLHSIYGTRIENDIQLIRRDLNAERDKMSGLIAGRDLKSDPLARMVDTKTHTPTILELLNALSRVTPDHTYLTAFEIEPGRLHVEGNSTSVTDLPKALADEPLFGDVSFSAPTAKRRDENGDSFQIDIAIKRQANTP